MTHTQRARISIYVGCVAAIVAVTAAVARPGSRLQAALIPLSIFSGLFVTAFVAVRWPAPVTALVGAGSIAAAAGLPGGPVAATVAGALATFGVTALLFLAPLQWRARGRPQG